MPAATCATAAARAFCVVCPCNGEGEAFQHKFTASQTAENLIVLIVEAASRIAIPVAHS
jgi:hypothetical protein